MKLGDVTDRVRDAIEGVVDRGQGSSDPPGATGSDGGECDSGVNDDDVREGGVRERLPKVTRRRVLAGVGALGAAKAADNVLVGYGVLTGTNLLRQDLQALASERMGPSPFAVDVAGTEVALAARAVHVDGAAYDLRTTTPERAHEADREHGLVAGDERGPIEELAADWDAIAADPARVEVRPQTNDAFFDAVANADARPYTVAALRGSEYDPATPETVRAFAEVDPGDDVDPSDPASVVDGLKEGFNERTSYDGLRYVAGSVEDNVFMGHGDLRRHFEEPVTFDALLEQRDAGMFCYEFVFRSIDALHAVPAHEQTTPVFAGVVSDARHKHVYTAIASAYRDDDALVVPLTFVDYTHSTLYDDYAADVVLGEGVEAYNSRHRATGMFWNGYVGGI